MNNERIWNIIEDYSKKVGFLTHQIQSFNDFILYGIQRILEEEPNIVVSQKENH